MIESKTIRLRELYEQRMQINAEMAQLLHEDSQMEVQDYALRDVDGKETTLSAVFGDHDKLVLVHNMGKDCPYCTMWADGLNGLFHYVEQGFDGTAARFILVNNDEPEEIRKFAASRGWNFDCYSCRGTSLFMDLGFASEHEGQTYYHPGFSTIVRDPAGRRTRYSAGNFGPGDSFCGVWHFYDHLPKDAAQQPE